MSFHLFISYSLPVGALNKGVMYEQSNIGLSGGAEASSRQAREQNELSWLTLIARDERRVVPHIQASVFMEARRSSVTCSRFHS